MTTTAHAPLRGALRVRMADGETCHADDLADALAGLVDALAVLDTARTAEAERAALRVLAVSATEAGALAVELGVVAPVPVTP